MISVLITAWKENKTIAKCVKSIADSKYSGIDEPFEVLLACPDDQTRQEAEKEIHTLGLEDKFFHIKDPGKGKPVALNMLMKKAKGDIWIFTDGDVYFGENAVKNLVAEFNDKSVKLVTGRPVSGDNKNNMMGYFGHLLADAADHKRTLELSENPVGKSTKLIKKVGFFPVSGYIYAMRADKSVKFPEDTLVDDAYISYLVFNNGGKIAYAEDAVAYIKYATNLKDYFKQKKRSTGGYVQLWEYGLVKPETKTRSVKKELEYFWFPFKYAKNIKEFIWSLCLYPIRLWLWIMIIWERRVVKKDFVKTWVRVESTK